MMKFLAPAALAAALALGACGQTTVVDDDTPAENAMEDAAQDVEEAADQAGDELEQAGDQAEDAINDATDGDPNTNP